MNMALNRITHDFRKGDRVRFNAAVVGPNEGTVIQISKRKVRVLFPVRMLLWMYPSQIVKLKEAR